MDTGSRKLAFAESMRAWTYSKRTQAQAIRFLLVGILNTLFGYAVFVSALALGFGVTFSLVLATIAGVLFNFQTIGAFVFRRREGRRLVPFILGYSLVLGINWVILKWTMGLGLGPAIAQALLLPLIAAMSFGINKLLVFRR